MALPFAVAVALAACSRLQLLPWLLLSVTSIGAVWLVGPVARIRAARAEVAWLDSLPFRCRGYLESLGGEAAVEVRVRVELVTESSEVRDMLSAAVQDFDPRVELRDGIVREIICLDGLSPVRRWLRSLFARSLLPLHAAHPIERVDVDIVSSRQVDG